MLTDHDRAQLVAAIAQLRHAYTHLVAGKVADQPRFAKGLLGPQIERLERLL